MSEAILITMPNFKSIEKCNLPCAREGRARETFDYQHQWLPQTPFSLPASQRLSSHTLIWKSGDKANWATFLLQNLKRQVPKPLYAFFFFTSVNDDKQCIFHHRRISNFFTIGYFWAFFLFHLLFLCQHTAILISLAL